MHVSWDLTCWPAQYPPPGRVSSTSHRYLHASNGLFIPFSFHISKRILKIDINIESKLSLYTRTDWNRSFIKNQNCHHTTCLYTINSMKVAETDTCQCVPVSNWFEQYSQQPSGLISALCVYTCEMSAILLHSISTGMSRAFLYFHWAASKRARRTWYWLSATCQTNEPLPTDLFTVRWMIGMYRLTGYLAIFCYICSGSGKNIDWRWIVQPADLLIQWSKGVLFFTKINNNKRKQNAIWKFINAKIIKEELKCLLKKVVASANILPSIQQIACTNYFY